LAPDHCGIRTANTCTVADSKKAINAGLPMRTCVRHIPAAHYTVLHFSAKKARDIGTWCQSMTSQQGVRVKLSVLPVSKGTRRIHWRHGYPLNLIVSVD
jgi:cell division FtsZ-interacting protein ZapD